MLLIPQDPTLSAPSDDYEDYYENDENQNSVDYDGDYDLSPQTGGSTTKAKIVRENSIVITGWANRYHKYIPKSSELYKGKSVKEWIEICVQCLKLPIRPLISEIPRTGRQRLNKN